MTTALAEHGPTAAAIEQVLIKGDLSTLTDAQRLAHYKNVCDSLGLNPLTQPFDYIKLNGKLVLYAKRDAAEQLRKIHGVSVIEISTQHFQDVYIVVAKAQDRTGRTDASTGVVPLGSLKGEALANALMKAETKAKRRVTLSICGLGMLDETEVDSIAVAPPPTRLQVERAATGNEHEKDGAPVHVPAVVDTESGEVLPECPPGYHYLTGYQPKGEWHEATLLRWDAQDGALHISTKQSRVGDQMLKADNEHIPVKADVTMKKNTKGEAYVNKLELLQKPKQPVDTTAPLTAGQIPF